MKSERLYPFLVLLILLLLIGSGALAFVFYRMLAQAPGPSSESGQQDAGGSGRSSLFSGWSFGSGNGERTPPGPDGSATKWGLRAPSSPPTGVGPNMKGADQLREGTTPPLGAFFGMPVVFDELCEEYGGEYSLLAPGTDIATFLSPGVLCLDVQRPEVYVPEDQKRTYSVPSVRSDPYNACDLSQTVKMCFELGKMKPESAQRGWHPIYGPSPVMDQDPTNLLTTWHSPFADAPVSPDDENRESTGAAAPPPNLDETTTRNSYFLNNDPRQWFSDLPPVASATQIDFQPGVDLTCYADQNRLEYVFVFWPETDPVDVEFTYDSAFGVREVGSRNIAIDYECATLYQHRAFAYEWYSGRPYETPVLYSIAGRTVRLEFIDRQQHPADEPLQAEAAGSGGKLEAPVTDYLSFLGGEGHEEGYAVAVDGNGYAYVAGPSTSPEFASGQRTGDASRDNVDVFVTKFRIADRKPIYTTFLGGRHDDRAFDIAPAPDGSVYLCGETLSPDFATVTPPPGGVLGRAWDAFIVKLDPAGQVSDFACRIGGRGDDRAFGIALDADQNVYIAGTTRSDDFPTTDRSAGAKGPLGGSDAFLLKLSAVDHDLLFSTRLGGSADDEAYALAIGPDQAPVLVGQTASKDLATFLPAQPNFGGGTLDAFVAKLASDGSRFAFLSYLGGDNDDRALALDVDLANAVWVAGETASTNFPTAQPVQPAFAGGNWDAFLTRLPPEGSPILRSTYLGGSGDDRGFALAVESSGRPHIGGATSSTNLPVLEPIQKHFGGGDGPFDAFLAGFDETLDTPRYLTYLGGRSNDAIYSIAIEAGRQVHIAGTTASRHLNVVDPIQSSHRGQTDALVGRFVSDYPKTPPLRLVPAGGMPNGPFYDFFMGKFEITNEEFVHFLNDAQANPDGPRGTNMLFDATGNAWMNPEMVRERDELFSIFDSRLVYNPTFPVGARYSVTPLVSRDGQSYTRHPVVGVSWYGAVKYCNWLTIETGRGEAHRCYREGWRPQDWAPITCSSKDWERGIFTSMQRFEWLRYRGFRLPMDNCAAPPDFALHFRVTHDEFADFLNDAEANPDTLRGTNMYFDADGNVAVNPHVEYEDQRMFSIEGTWLRYDSLNAAGARYSVAETPPDISPPAYADRVISNVTWFGAMKYCNWLTMLDDRDPAQRAYREGSRPQDWAPATASQDGWARGQFTEQERRAWLLLHGYRLPFISVAARTNSTDDLSAPRTPTNSWANAFNEVLKASGWLAGTNASYAFGRDTFDYQDANYLDSGMFAKHDTTPAGFYDGSNHDGRSMTRTNENIFGCYDLSGNASEWTTDPGIAGSSLDRSYYGGSWRFPLTPNSDRFYVHPYFTENFMGFRIVTVTASDRMCVLRIPFRLCVCGYGVGAGCGRGEGTEEQKKGTQTTLKKEGEEETSSGRDREGVITSEEEGEEGGGEDEGDEDGDDGGEEGQEGGDEVTSTIATSTIATTTETTTSSSSTTLSAVSPGDDGSGAGTVILCHKPAEDPGNPRTIEVPLSAVPAHLAHGDSLGPCP